MLLFAVLSAFIYHNALAQGPMFKPDPRASPQQAPNATLMFGDIAMTPEQMRAKELGPEAFNAVIGQHLRWKDAIIPYRIDCSIENYPDAVSAVKKAMAQWERKTCIRFVPYTNQKFKLTFFRNTHCWGNVGQVSYSRISVGPGCEYEHVMAHEIGHVVGLYHEQNRKDRDDWVNVFWENIGQFKDAFDIVKNTDPLGIQYDYESIMHYPWTAFSINGKPTMAPKRPTKGKIPYIEISHDDIELVSRMYNCPEIERKRKHHAMRVRKRIAKAVPNTFNREDCVERVRDCEDWAKQGRCHEPDVSRQCHRSCMARSCYGGPCTDGHVRDCPIWAKMGHCKFVDSVQMDCQKSCNPVCKGEKPLTPPPTKKPITFTFPTELPHKKGDNHSWPNYNYLGTGFRCLDKHPQCPEWAKMGECRRNPGWMHRNCKKSCPDSRCDRTVLKPPGTCNNPMGISVDPEGKYQLPDSAMTATTMLSPGRKYKLPDSAMTATTMLSPGSGWHAAGRNARLYFEDDYDNHRIAAWCPANRVGQLTVDLGQEKTLTYIATQGRDQYFERVAEFQIQYSNDGQTFTTHKEKGQDRTFFGNCDHSTPVLNKFEDPIKARYIRYIPVESQYDNYPCVRMELYGC